MIKKVFSFLFTKKPAYLGSGIRNKFDVGDRVLVSSGGGWEKDFIGTITDGPNSVETRQGEDYMYWVSFEEDQKDIDGDGPYYKAEILSRYLKHAK